jgi:P2 family phage contractile tail tube protein
MAMPRVLKDMTLYNEGFGYLGECQTVTLPPPTLKIEEWRASGMIGALGLDMGIDGLMELTATFGGPMRDILRQFGVTTAAGVYLRWVGAYQQEDTGAVDTIEIVVRGRHREIAMGDQEVGEVGEFSVTSVLAYYKLIWNGRTEIEYDPLAGILIVDGEDRYAAIRNALGRF